MIAGRRNQLGLRALLMCSLALLLSPALAWGSPALAAGVPASAKYPAGCLASPFDASLVRLPPSLTVGVPAVLPPAMDLSASLPPIGDQQYTNSCTGWASTYYAKTMMEKKEHPSWDVTDPMYQFSPSWTYNQVNDCGNDTGAFLTDVMKLLAQRGAVDIQEMPFTKDNTATQPIRKQIQAALPYRNSGYGAFWLHSQATDPTPYTTPNPIETMKAWLAAGNPVVIAIPLVDGIPASDGRDAPLHYFDYEGDGMAFGHAMCVVGYDDNANPAGADTDHRGGFKIVNSFGADWNGSDKGFIYFSYDFMKRHVWEAWYMEDTAPDAPVLDSISASRSNVFGAVTLRGGNFGAYRRAARVSFNGVDSPFMAYSNGQVTALVPEGATSGPLTLYDWEGTATASLPFVVGGIEPTGALVNSATPGTCTTGNTVTVTAEGAGFAADSQLYLMGVSENRIPADSQVVTGSTAIRGVFDLDGALPGTYLVTVRAYPDRDVRAGRSWTERGGHETVPSQPSYVGIRGGAASAMRPRAHPCVQTYRDRP